MSGRLYYSPNEGPEFIRSYVRYMNVKCLNVNLEPLWTIRKSKIGRMSLTRVNCERSTERININMLSI